uniref:Protein NBR1 homolog n=1 Tax=Davidia involucrata TaxID=16924 RepID=A0A5B7B204_DAVIN
MDSTIVIKVKFGDTLRRFSACLDENEKLDLDMGRLREKVLSLFNFAPDADPTFTYIDEDGDVVTLVDEDDLLDVVRQGLNPLRITVTLNTEKGGRSYARSSGCSTPMRSPRVQHPLPSLDTSVAEILKSIPEPFCEALPKLSLDLASKAASSAPGLAELVHCFLKMGQSYLKPVSEFQAGVESSTQSGASGSTMDASGTTKGPEAPKDDGATSEVLPNAKLEEPKNAKLEETTPKKNQEVDPGNVTSGIGASVTHDTGSLNLNVSLSGDSFPSGSGKYIYVGDKEELKKLSECHLSGKSLSFASVNPTPVAPNVPAGENNKEMKSREGWKSLGVGASTSSCNMDSQTTDLGGGTSKRIPNDFGKSSVSHLGVNPFNECPVNWVPLAPDSDLRNIQYGSLVFPFKRSYNHSDGMGSIFHRGIRCDGCGVHPITGPRFKSKVKEDYDLCSICFSEMGNEADYIKIDRPVSFRHPWSFKGLYDPMHHTRGRPPTLPHVLRGCGMKQSRPKLDSRFIRDVNVLDGTVMAPSTPFTKIWRMRNNGTVVWPLGTQLVWIGGDRLSNNLSVEVEIPVDGLHADKELDIAVDFTAPQLPGRYISYWRMASPSGQKFGQRVWVLIQVDAALRDSLGDGFHGLNLNLPPESNGRTVPEIHLSDGAMIDDFLLDPENSNRATESAQPTVDEQLIEDPELNFPINDTLLVGGGFSSPFPPKSPSVSYPIIDFSEVAPTAPSLAPPPVTNVPPSAQEVSENNDVEQNLLRELEEMGFKQVDLNKEILRMNEYDLEQSVDDLCGVAEWDPILEELQEMGFCDKEMNKKLLKKNNGSIKRVVMDLVAGEKA